MKRALMILSLVALAGCASSKAFRAAEQAERRQDYDRAVLEYSRALKLSPENVDYQRSLRTARTRAVRRLRW